jgi:N-sulfoglucosamine sulfohydrolase
MKPAAFLSKVLLLPGVCFLALFQWTAWSSEAAAPRLNVLFLTADDMNYDTPGFTGGPVRNVTPHLDRLAAEGMWFARGQVTVAVCQPSRQCLMTGRYPHHNGSTGFYPVRDDVPTLAELLKAAGYHLGILGKEIHLRPEAKFPWHFMRSEGELARGRDPAKYHQFTREFLEEAKASGKPFFLMANSHDPHRPYAGSEGGKSLPYPPPDRTFTPEEITVPAFLPDLPEVRKELAQYYSSARRCDQSLGAVLRALKESGLEENTLVMFVSDNGIAMPFAKSNCYLTSTRTPWLVRWPGKVKPGRVDREHFISGIDYLPTVLEAVGLPLPPETDGRSFLPLLEGGPQTGRDRVFTCYNEAFGNKAYPMRCLQDKRFGYIYNSWADGKKSYSTEGMSGLTFKAMQQAGTTQPAIADRVELLVHRTPEELYDFAADPAALRNLAADPACQDQLRKMRSEMLLWMEQTRDPLLAPFRALTKNQSPKPDGN